MITISDIAAKEIFLTMKEEGLSPLHAYVRFNIEGTGNSGFKYVISLVSSPHRGDAKTQSNGVLICVDQTDYHYLSDLYIDYNYLGFSLKNRLVADECGCRKAPDDPPLSISRQN